MRRYGYPNEPVTVQGPSVDLDVKLSAPAGAGGAACIVSPEQINWGRDSYGGGDPITTVTGQLIDDGGQTYNNGTAYWVAHLEGELCDASVEWVSDWTAAGDGEPPLLIGTHDRAVAFWRAHAPGGGDLAPGTMTVTAIVRTPSGGAIATLGPIYLVISLDDGGYY